MPRPFSLADANPSRDRRKNRVCLLVFGPRRQWMYPSEAIEGKGVSRTRLFGPATLFVAAHRRGLDLEEDAHFARFGPGIFLLLEVLLRHLVDVLTRAFFGDA